MNPTEIAKQIIKDHEHYKNEYLLDEVNTKEYCDMIRSLAKAWLELREQIKDIKNKIEKANEWLNVSGSVFSLPFTNRKTAYIGGMKVVQKDILAIMDGKEDEAS